MVEVLVESMVAEVLVLCRRSEVAEAISIRPRVAEAMAGRPEVAGAMCSHPEVVEAMDRSEAVEAMGRPEVAVWTGIGEVFAVIAPNLPYCSLPSLPSYSIPRLPSYSVPNLPSYSALPTGRTRCPQASRLLGDLPPRQSAL
jgi:hypothetical protein